MSAIEAASVACKTMADGTLRVTFDIEPHHAQQAFALFGSPGVPAALARLVVGAQPEPEPEKPKGGPLAKSAGIICATPMFQAYAALHLYQQSEVGAADMVRGYCGVSSRAELDANVSAQRKFATLMAEYRAWCADQPEMQGVEA